ncbi:ABC transporter ATP-binding protein [Salinarimonas ramus]|uniref:Sugar ABC transporter ATP-binding protein n=1 Tax=Salinarimonas ramus TaxID=690164 RepID=A0A917QAX7_9HYPH|nr:sn-glycerol-3-phosphate ABC transporter ATP-binding protein UgpC [Salinarimonas ramus]GGK41354.1 sugar ABC transporter ATP-binding protein [Salinarimonas ramus]
MATIELENIVKRFGSATVVHGLDLAIADGEFVALVGPSGCGKSTTLRMIAGLEDVSAGTLRIGGVVVNHHEPKRRNVAMVFQNYAIYPHLTVRENIAFGLYTSGLPKEKKAARVDEAARILGLEDLLERRPAALSGGQRQRVAIGRAMVRNPSAFLFDEPLSNLDAQLRNQMRIEIKRLHQRIGATTVYVTHDQVEAMTMADRIVVMRDGRILQIGSPSDLYDAPADVFTARFIGTPAMNLLPARHAGEAIAVDGATGTIPAPPFTRGSERLLVGVRPQDMRVASDEDAQGALTLTGTVTAVEPLGPETHVHLDTAGGPVIALAEGRGAPAVGAPATAFARLETLHFFDAQTERALSGRAGADGARRT